MKDLEEDQLNRYLDGEATPEETAHLLEWAGKSDTNAKLFAEAMLQEQLAAELYQEGQIPEVRTARHKWPSWTAPLAIAALLVLSFTLSGLWPGKQPQPNGFAWLGQSVGARWSDGQAVETGQWVGAEKLELESGLVRLDFRSGVNMSVEGPAKLWVKDAMNVYFESGVATFHVPDGAEGFTVGTEDGEVVDLGTAFGISTRSEGRTEVAVFEGEVEVHGQRVKEGNTVRASKDKPLLESSFDTSAFRNTWPVTSGVLQTTGRLRFVSPGPDFVPGKFEDNEHMTVFLERRKTVTSAPIQVDLSDPGEFRKLRLTAGPVIPAGMTVNSYLIQLDPVGLLEKKDPDKRQARGQITFSRPILGLIASGKKLLATDAALGHPKGDYGNLPRGIEPPKENASSGKDSLVLAADQRTLVLNFSAGSAVDQIRVLVEAGETDLKL